MPQASSTQMILGLVIGIAVLIFLPTSFITEKANCSAAPDFSRTAPIITPKPMMIPVLLNVLPNPVVIEDSTDDTSIPPIKPVIIAAKINAKNVCTFVFIDKNIKTAIPITNPKIICVTH